jgi:hypothetical protein
MLLSIGCNGKYIEESPNTKFLGLQIDNHLNWAYHTDKLIPKLDKAYYAIRSTFHISKIDTPKSVYFACFPSIKIME